MQTPRDAMLNDGASARQSQDCRVRWTGSRCCEAAQSGEGQRGEAKSSNWVCELSGEKMGGSLQRVPTSAGESGEREGRSAVRLLLGQTSAPLAPKPRDRPISDKPRRRARHALGAATAAPEGARAVRLQLDVSGGRTCSPSAPCPPSAASRPVRYATPALHHSLPRVCPAWRVCRCLKWERGNR